MQIQGYVNGLDAAIRREDVLTLQLQAKGKTVDANINMITAGSPLSFNLLDEEANMLRTQLVTQLYSAE